MNYSSTFLDVRTTLKCQESRVFAFANSKLAPEHVSVAAKITLALGLVGRHGRRCQDTGHQAY